MTGFWDGDLPVSSGREDVKTTVYENAEGELLICFASFAEESVSFAPEGIPEGFEAFLPEIEGMQERKEYRGGAVEIAPSSGVILLAKRK